MGRLGWPPRWAGTVPKPGHPSRCPHRVNSSNPAAECPESTTVIPELGRTSAPLKATEASLHESVAISLVGASIAIGGRNATSRFGHWVHEKCASSLTVSTIALGKQPLHQAKRLSNSPSMFGKYRVTPIEKLGKPGVSRPSNPTSKAEPSVDLPKHLDASHDLAVIQAGVNLLVQCNRIQTFGASVEGRRGDVRAADESIAVQVTNHGDFSAADRTSSVEEYFNRLLVRVFLLQISW